MRKLLVTGSNGLIGSEMVQHFHDRGWTVYGVDNNMRADFFGLQGDTRWNQERLLREFQRYRHVELDIRNRPALLQLVNDLRPEAVIHAAAQPSHDLAAKRPFDDFDTNAGGTLNVLEAMRQSCPESPLVHFSTNKVYGDAPNLIQLQELETRWAYDDQRTQTGLRKRSPSISRNTRCSGLPKSLPTSWCRNTAAISVCRPVVCGAAV
jgi:CDP-paratose 2-epimerase